MIERKKYNLAILNKLEEFLKEHPDFRFIQALWALDIIDRDENNLIIDRFYEEPNKTLDKVKKSLKEFPMREKREKEMQENLASVLNHIKNKGKNYAK